MSSASLFCTGVSVSLWRHLHKMTDLLFARFLPADALWNLSMALNVYFTVFRGNDIERLQQREPWVSSFSIAHQKRSDVEIVCRLQRSTSLGNCNCSAEHYHSGTFSRVWRSVYLVLDINGLGMASHSDLLRYCMVSEPTCQRIQLIVQDMHSFSIRHLHRCRYENQDRATQTTPSVF